MPFPTTKTKPEHPSVTILCNGLMIISPTNARSNSSGSQDPVLADIGVLRTARNHLLSVEAFIGGQEPSLPVFRYRGPLFAEMRISTKYPRGVTKFCPEGSNSNHPIRQSGYESDNDIHQAIDLASREFYQSTGLNIDRGRVEHGITLETGVLYTAQLSEEEIRFCSDDGQDKFKRHIAASIGAAIELSDDDDLTLTYQFDYETQHYSLRDANKPHQNFIICIDNSPNLVGPGADPHDEMKEYNGVIEGLSPAQEIVICRSKITAKVPCMTALAGA